jgi:Fe-S-cluster containining protein
VSFDCKRCGACCRLVGTLPDLAHLDRGDLTCKHLTPANLCGIYEERPKLCRVDESCPPVLTAQAWRSRNEDACERLHLAVYGASLGGA